MSGAPNRRRRKIPTTSADVRVLENMLRKKLYEKTTNKAKGAGIGLAFAVFTDGVEFPQIDRDNFEYGLNTRLNLGWDQDAVDKMFHRYDRDGDGIISHDEFSRFLMPPDIVDPDAINIKAEKNTLLGYHSLRRELPRRPRQSRLLAARAERKELPPMKQGTWEIELGKTLPIRQSNFNQLNPEPAFDLGATGFGSVPGWHGSPPPSGAPGRDPRRRKMDAFPPPTPHMFKSFRV